MMNDHNSPSTILAAVFHTLRDPYVNKDLTQHEWNKLYSEMQKHSQEDMQ